MSGVVWQDAEIVAALRHQPVLLAAYVLVTAGIVPGDRCALEELERRRLLWIDGEDITLGPRPLAELAVSIGTASEWRAVLRADPCAYCGAGSEHVDHIEPRAVGGRDDWANFTGACADCNRRKSTSSLLEFLHAN